MLSPLVLISHSREMLLGFGRGGRQKGVAEEQLWGLQLDHLSPLLAAHPPHDGGWGEERVTAEHSPTPCTPDTCASPRSDTEGTGAIPCDLLTNSNLAFASEYSVSFV